MRPEGFPRPLAVTLGVGFAIALSLFVAFAFAGNSLP